MIPDEAIELALIANWDTEGDQKERMRAALEAAAPYLMAQAWEEGCRKGLGTNPGWEDEALARNPYRTSK